MARRDANTVMISQVSEVETEPLGLLEKHECISGLPLFLNNFLSLQCLELAQAHALPAPSIPYSHCVLGYSLPYTPRACSYPGYAACYNCVGNHLCTFPSLQNMHYLITAWKVKYALPFMWYQVRHIEQLISRNLVLHDSAGQVHTTTLCNFHCTKLFFLPACKNG